MFSAAFAWYTAHAAVIFAVAVVGMLLAEVMSGRSRQTAGMVGSQATSVLSGLVFMAVKTLVGKVAFVSLAMVVYEKHRLFTLDTTNPLVWLGMLSIRDFVYYWVHRTEHKVRFFWASHMVHHSPETIGFSTAVRVPWMEALYKPWLGLWVPLLGFNPVAFVALDALAATIGVLQHTEAWKRRTALDSVFVTPAAHRVHHGSNVEYIDKNFGAIFIVWDRLFGTYEPEVAPVVYGLIGSSTVSSPAEALVGGYPKLFAAARRRGTVGKQLAYLVGAPGGGSKLGGDESPLRMMRRARLGE